MCGFEFLKFKQDHDIFILGFLLKFFQHVKFCHAWDNCTSCRQNGTSLMLLTTLEQRIVLSK